MITTKSRRSFPWFPAALFLAALVLSVLAWFPNAGAGAPPASDWSSFSSGPLTCVAYRDKMLCAARQTVSVEPYEPYEPTEPSEQSLERPTSFHAAAEQQHECIALAVFTEARGESLLGQAAVAQTVVNRAKRLHTDACEVVTQVLQYQGLEHLRSDPWLIDKKAWDRAVQVSTSVALRNYDTGACAKATSFHSGDETPASFRSLTEVCRVGAHRFYAEG